MNKDYFDNYLNNFGYDTEEYSGRGMFGKTCLAVVTDETPFRFCAKLMRGAKNDEEREKLAVILQGTKEDSLGMGRIFYWPDLK